mgnify:CR=1 FL=1
MHTWTTTQQEGWLRIGLDEYGIPYDYISVHEARDIPDLKSRWDVILMGPSSGDALSLLRGLQGDDPIPWRKSDLTPNLGTQDETDDMRGGLGLEGVLHLARFVENGGVFVTIGNTSALPIHFGIADGVQIRTTSELWAPGGVYRARVADTESPLSYGYGPELGVYFNRAPVFASGGGGGRFRGMGGRGGGSELRPSTDGSTTARRTGRGSVSEQDIVQGRPKDMGKAGVEAFREDQEGEETPSFGFGMGGGGSSARVVARFAPRATELLISGGLVAGGEMANAPAVVDSPRGEGHVVMFSFNPFWRGETHGAYAMLLNAVLHHEHLGVGGEE